MTGDIGTPSMMEAMLGRLHAAAWAHPVLCAAFLPVFLLVCLCAWAYPYRAYTLPYRNVRGPKSGSIIMGNLREILDNPPSAPQTRWIEEFGNVCRYQTVFGKPQLLVADLTAIAYMTQNTYDFVKPETTVFVLEQVLGRGVLTVEGSPHRRQRRILGPAFGPPAIKSMHDIFLDKAGELQRKLSSFIECGHDDATAETSMTPPASEDRVPCTRKVDVLKYMSQMTLDVIGLAGLDYDFGGESKTPQFVSALHLRPPFLTSALEETKTNELADSVQRMLIAGANPGSIDILSLFIKPLRLIPTRARRGVADARATCSRISKGIVATKKKLVEDELEAGEKDETMGKDLLSRIVRANMDSTMRPEQRMSNEEVVAQVSSFMLAGNETTSAALTWALLRLALNPKAQQKLRNELLSVDNDRPSFDELNSLPYLDKVVHESSRLDPPIRGGVRVATKHTALPLSNPVLGRDGKFMDQVVIAPGTDIYVPVAHINRSTEIWGADAAEFNPDRFDVDGIPKKHVPGVYGNVLTFYGGARNCIGYRLSLAEMKAALFALVRHIEFLPLPSNPNIKAKEQIVTRPMIEGEEDKGYQLPLLLRAVQDSF